MIPMLFKESFSLKLSNFSPSPSPCLPWSPGRLFWSVRRLSQGSPPSKLFQHDTKRFGTWPSGGFRCQDHWPGEAQRGACTDARRTWLLWCHVAWRQWFVGKFLLGWVPWVGGCLGGFGGEWRPKMPKGPRFQSFCFNELVPFGEAFHWHKLWRTTTRKWRKCLGKTPEILLPCLMVVNMLM